VMRLRRTAGVVRLLRTAGVVRLLRTSSVVHLLISSPGSLNSCYSTFKIHRLFSSLNELTPYRIAFQIRLCVLNKMEDVPDCGTSITVKLRRTCLQQRDKRASDKDTPSC
jgi:hypothetical protein